MKGETICKCGCKKDVAIEHGIKRIGKSFVHIDLATSKDKLPFDKEKCYDENVMWFY